MYLDSMIVLRIWRWGIGILGGGFRFKKKEVGDEGGGYGKKRYLTRKMTMLYMYTLLRLL
jgi:hypothetical protein